LINDKRFIKFLFVGALNALFGFSMYSLLLFMGFHYTLAVLYGTILGILFNFKTTGHLVFGNKSNRLIFSFIAVYAVVYALNILGLRVFEHFNINLYLAGFVLLLPMALVSFCLMKKFVFGGKNVSEKEN